MALLMGTKKSAGDPSLTWSCGTAFNLIIQWILLDLHEDMLDGSFGHSILCYEVLCGEFLAILTVIVIELSDDEVAITVTQRL